MSNEQKKQGLPEDDIVRGMAGITAYTGYSKTVIKTLYREAGFPMAMIGGAWESSKAMICEWRREQIRTSGQAGRV